ncbi:hypothetical protein C8J56DRAFT_1126064 [Mycena floridula]|nr:hypothetical protein C8J56DRAFT_1126064 [Mycena floridula]
MMVREREREINCVGTLENARPHFHQASNGSVDAISQLARLARTNSSISSRLIPIAWEHLRKSPSQITPSLNGTDIVSLLGPIPESLAFLAQCEPTTLHSTYIDNWDNVSNWMLSLTKNILERQDRILNFDPELGKSLYKSMALFFYCVGEIRRVDWSAGEEPIALAQRAAKSPGYLELLARLWIHGTRWRLREIEHLKGDIVSMTPMFHL